MAVIYIQPPGYLGDHGVFEPQYVMFFGLCALREKGQFMSKSQKRGVLETSRLGSDGKLGGVGGPSSANEFEQKGRWCSFWVSCFSSHLPVAAGMGSERESDPVLPICSPRILPSRRPKLQNRDVRTHLG